MWVYASRNLGCDASRRAFRTPNKSTSRRACFRDVFVALVLFVSNFAVCYGNDPVYSCPTTLDRGESRLVGNKPKPLPTVPLGGGFTSNQFGTGTGGLVIPYTTAAAYGARYNSGSMVETSEPTKNMPYSAVGKLRDGGGYYCSASMIAPNLVITSAHCVADFGAGCHNWGSFTASEYSGTYLYRANWAAVYVPTSYIDGTDVCDPGAPGILCENDIALVVVDNISTPASLAGQRPGDVGGYFNYASGDYGYTDLNGSGTMAAQITLVGYSGNLESGQKMFTTTSIGIQDAINNVMIGSGSAGGSSGGPWLVNFGVGPTDSSASGSVDQVNTVVATTSWGYISTSPKIQGASRFGTNTAFPSKSNIQTLVDFYCCSLSTEERTAQCADRASCGSPP